ncbi:MAG: hypothetical protein AUG51_02820 [Acidobacteria bacterium 13_1_20CM_3_53_8]|nr:MAG: hypothetical protein AUG51_02820 [Acidobacteria bacterium 13_1_20CM_3_53_8]
MSTEQRGIPSSSEHESKQREQEATRELNSKYPLYPGDIAERSYAPYPPNPNSKFPENEKRAESIRPILRQLDRLIPSIAEYLDSSHRETVLNLALAMRELLGQEHHNLENADRLPKDFVGYELRGALSTAHDSLNHTISELDIDKP